MPASGPFDLPILRCEGSFLVGTVGFLFPPTRSGKFRVAGRSLSLPSASEAGFPLFLCSLRQLGAIVGLVSLHSLSE